MFSLRLAAYLLIAPVVAGSFVIALLTMNMLEARSIAVAAAAGAVVSVPLAWWLAGHLNKLIQPKKS